MRGGRLGGGGTEQKGKWTHGYGQQGGDCWVGAGIRGLSGNRENMIEIIYLKKHKRILIDRKGKLLNGELFLKRVSFFCLFLCIQSK